MVRNVDINIQALNETLIHVSVCQMTTGSGITSTQSPGPASGSTRWTAGTGESSARVASRVTMTRVLMTAVAYRVLMTRVTMTRVTSRVTMTRVLMTKVTSRVLMTAVAYRVLMTRVAYRVLMTRVASRVLMSTAEVNMGRIRAVTVKRTQSRPSVATLHGIRCLQKVKLFRKNRKSPKK